MSLQDFEAVYSNDVFYSWFGLNTAEVYRAHRLAGGITSLYRQIGVGCERLTQTIVCDTLSLSAEQIVWSYTVPTPDGKNRRISLDAKISLDDVKDSTKRESLQKWMEAAVGMAPAVSRLSGVVFEVRQGYKTGRLAGTFFAEYCMVPVPNLPTCSAMKFWVIIWRTSSTVIQTRCVQRF
jgi:hypothetical protein